jgi:hypothetical protein
MAEDVLLAEETRPYAQNEAASLIDLVVGRHEFPTSIAVNADDRHDDMPC